LVLRGNLDRIGLKDGIFQASKPDHENFIEQHWNLPNHDVALKVLFNWLEDNSEYQDLDAVGHRVVHGGKRFTHPHIITPEAISKLKELVSLAPEHLSHEIRAIEAISKAYPNLKQVACFDTAFHRHMPKKARMYALPRNLWDEGIIHYGFHGLSYEYIMYELGNQAGFDATNGRVVIAHLGNGASMTAVKQGKGVDTTMGFTPTGGLVMSTRSGDLDPGIILYLLEEKDLSASMLNEMLNKKAGLLGISGISSDIKDLLNDEGENSHAAEAIELFCYQAKKFLGAMTAVLGGLDTLIFTGGIGENAPEIRRRICEQMEFLGIHLDPSQNDANASIISCDGAPAIIRVMKTNEELMIARHTNNIIKPNPFEKNECEKH